MKISWKDKGVFWERIQHKDGSLWHHPSGNGDYYDHHHCYFVFDVLPNRERMWGYFGTPYDGQGHEGFGLWFFNVNWSVNGSAKRVYSDKEPHSLVRKLLYYKWPDWGVNKPLLREDPDGE